MKINQIKKEHRLANSYSQIKNISFLSSTSSLLKMSLMYDVPTQSVRLFEQTTDRLDITRELLEDHALTENMQ